MDLIDRIRNDIQDRLDAVLGEADKLRKALSALDPRSAPGSPGGGASRSRNARSGGSGRSSRGSASSQRSGSSQRSRSSQRSGSSQRSRSTQGSRRSGRRASTRRTPPGATKNRVLETLADGRPRTAGEVAEATGLARGTVSTTLSKLARAGDLVKAERGYRLPTESAPGAAAATPASDGQ